MVTPDTDWFSVYMRQTCVYVCIYVYIIVLEYIIALQAQHLCQSKKKKTIKNVFSYFFKMCYVI